MAFSVIYEDDSLIAVNKSCGIPVIIERGRQPIKPLNERVEAYCNHRLYVVHRIDKETSGIVLFAKDASAHKKLSLQFEQRRVTKRYLAVVQGITEEYGCINAPVYQFGSGRMGVREGGKYSETSYQRKNVVPGISLVSAKPLTGRRHQIRVHMYHIGHPILGDPLYGEDRPVGGATRLMLHASELEVLHPNGRRCSFFAETSHDWNETFSKYFIE